MMSPIEKTPQSVTAALEETDVTPPVPSDGASDSVKDPTEGKPAGPSKDERKRRRPPQSDRGIAPAPLGVIPDPFNYTDKRRDP